MALDIQDFVSQAEGVELEDVPPRVQRRLNEALASLTGGEGGPTGPGGSLSDLVVSASRGTEDGDPYATVSGALADATAGDVVFVEPGTYDESGRVTIDTRNISLVSTEGPAGATLEAQVIVEADGATVDGFDVSPPPATGNQEGEALRVSGGASGVTVQNNIVRDFSEDGVPTYEGIGGIVAFGGLPDDPVENVRVLNNEVRRISGRTRKGGASGISVQGNVDGAIVKNNVVAEIGLEATAYCFGVVIRGSANEGSGVPRNVTITRNDIRAVKSTDTGPEDALFGVGIENEADAAEITATRNNIVNVELLAENKDTDDTLDATENWWGESGPDPSRILNPADDSGADVGGRGPVEVVPYLDAPFDEGGQPTDGSDS